MSWAPTACCSCWSRAVPQRRVTSTAPVWSIATSSTSPRRSSAATTRTALFDGAGAWDISEVWRGEFVAVERVGSDLRIEMAAARDEA